MIRLRASEDRGVTDLGWLTSRHTFSFGSYFDPKHTRFRNLRVLNDDWIEPDSGFGRHPHREMEIVSYVLEGALAHEDSAGHRTLLRAGEAQRMTAGRGIVHSEMNGAPGERTHFLQIWLEPRESGLEPGHEQRPFDPSARPGELLCIASGAPHDEALTLHADADIHLADLPDGVSLEVPLSRSGNGWIHVTDGRLTVGKHRLGPGDGAVLEEESAVRTTAGEEGARFLFFDLA